MKKSIHYAWFISLFFTFNISFAQSYEALKNVKIPANATIIKTVKIKTCKDTIPKGSVVKTELTKKNGQKVYTITKIDSVKNDTTSFAFEKTINIKMTDFGGKANITNTEENKTKLQLNYWLNQKNTIPTNSKLITIKKELKCPLDINNITINDYKQTRSKAEILTKDTEFYLYKVVDSASNKGWFNKKSWFIHSPKIIEVYKDSTTSKIEYYLVDKYESTGNYSLTLKNREYVSYKGNSFAFGPVTIPFKQRFGFTTENNVMVKSEFSTELNIGIFGGYKMGRYRVRAEGKSLKKLANISGTIGGFMSVSSITLDKNSTTTAETPYEDEETATYGALSPGLGVMLDIYNFNVGAFLGWDIAFGSKGSDWNYNKKPWFGFGIGYNVNNFWKKE